MTDPVSRLVEIRAAAATHGPDAEQVGWLLEHIEQLQQQVDQATRYTAEVTSDRDDARRTAHRWRVRAEAAEAQRQAVLDLCDAWLNRTPGERAAADADSDPLARSYHRGLVDGSATAIDRVRLTLGADDDR